MPSGFISFWLTKCHTPNVFLLPHTQPFFKTMCPRPLPFKLENALICGSDYFPTLFCSRINILVETWSAPPVIRTPAFPLSRCLSVLKRFTFFPLSPKDGWQGRLACMGYTYFTPKRSMGGVIQVAPLSSGYPELLGHAPNSYLFKYTAFNEFKKVCDRVGCPTLSH